MLSVLDDAEQCGTWLSRFLVTEMIIAMFATVGRGDPNVALAILGLYAVKNRKKDFMGIYVLTFLLAFIVDIIWLATVGKDIDKLKCSQASGTAKEVCNTAKFSLAMSIMNIIIKFFSALLVYKFYVLMPESYHEHSGGVSYPPGATVAPPAQDPGYAGGPYAGGYAGESSYQNA